MGATATGTVTFSGAGPPDIVPVDSGGPGPALVDSDPFCAVSAGTHTVRATYSSGGTGAGASSGRSTLTVVPDPTTTGFSTDALTAGQPLQVTVSSDDTAAVPTGTVQVTGTSDPAPLLLHLVGGVATVPPQWLAPGPDGSTYALSATYGPTRDFGGSSATTAVSVGVAPESLSLTETPGARTTLLSATLSPARAGTFRAAGTVVFLGRSLTDTTLAVLGSAPLDAAGTARLSLPTAALSGVQIFEARFDGGAGLVAALFQDVLGRPPSANEAATAEGQLANGTAASSVAGGLLSGAEYRSDLVTRWYQAYLGRPADAEDDDYFVGLLNEGATDQEVQADILGSGEFFADAGGTDAGFVEALSQDVLGRPADSEDQAYLGGELAGGDTRTQVATQVLSSDEYLGDLVTGWYQSYLGRPADTGTENYFIGLLAGGATNEQVQGQVLGSAEFAAHAAPDNFAPASASAVTPAVGAFLTALFQDLLDRSPSAAEVAAAAAQLGGGSTAAQLADEFLTGPEYRSDLVNGWYQAYLGRPADAEADNYFVGLLAGGATDEAVQADILGSAEFFSDAGGSDPAFVGALFHDVLDRSAGNSDISYFDSELAGGDSRTAVASQLLTSAEYQGDLVDHWFEAYLGRPADAGDQNYFAGLLAGGATDEQVQSAILGSPDFVAQA